MGIEISSAETTPSVTYNRIHLTRLEISQPVQASDSAAPIYEVIINYRYFGVVNGTRFYKNEDVQRIGISDFLTLALANAGQGDTTLITALQSIELAVATIIAEQTGSGTTVI